LACGVWDSRFVHLDYAGGFKVVDGLALKERFMKEVWFFGSFGIPLNQRKAAKFIMVGLLVAGWGSIFM